MDSVKEIIFALVFIVTAGFGIKELQGKIQRESFRTIQKGLTPLSKHTSRLTKIPTKRIEQGFLE